MPEFDADRCMFCGGCAAVCPGEAIVVFAAHVEQDRKACTDCGNCTQVCPSGAMHL